MLYVLPGCPAPIMKHREKQPRRQWDEHQNMRAYFGVILSSQHGDAPLYKGPLHVELCFFFEFLQPISPKNLEKVRGRLHVVTPGLSDLVQFVEWVGKGILFSNDYGIASLSAKKCYDVNPRTEIVINTLE